MFECFVLAISLIVMMLASVQDILRREVSDACWMALCTLAVLVVAVSRPGPIGALEGLALMLFALYMFSPRIQGMVSVSVLALSTAMLVSVSLMTSDPTPTVAAAMAVAIILLYSFGIIRGGADAKALLSLSLLFPSYPAVGAILWSPVYPEDLVFNPVFSATFIALMISIMWTLHTVLSSGRYRGCRPGQYMVPISEAKSSFVWPAEDIRDGRRVSIGVTDEADEVYERLESAGYENVRVTPMIPFIPMITAGLTIVLILGTPLNLLIS